MSRAPCGGAPGAAASAQSQPFALPTDWSRDGRFIALDNGLGDEVEEVWSADVAERKFVPLFQNKFPQWGTAFSPDGKHIAFVSIESGRPEVYVQRFESTPSAHVAGEKRHDQRFSIRCFAGRPAVHHADNRLRSAAAPHGHRELARQVSPLICFAFLPTASTGVARYSAAVK